MALGAHDAGPYRLRHASAGGDTVAAAVESANLPGAGQRPGAVKLKTSDYKV